MIVFIRQLIANGKLRVAIDLLRERPEPDVTEAATLLSFRAAELARKESEGTESEAVLGARRAQIAQSVLQLAANLRPTESTSGPVARPLPTPAPRSSRDALSRPVSTFISYAHADVGAESAFSALAELTTHLTPLAREAAIEIWSDKTIEYGRYWDPSIGAAIARAQLAILLVTPSFLASDYVARHELPELLRRNHEESLRLIPVLVERSDPKAAYRFAAADGTWHTVPISALQFVNALDQPLSQLGTAARHSVWLNVVSAIRNMLDE